MKFCILFLAAILLMPMHLEGQELSWARQLGGFNQDEGHRVSVDDSGNVYAIGYFQGSADFDPGPAAYDLAAVRARDVFIWKLDSSGSLVWARQLGGLEQDDGWGIDVDGAGNVYAAGTFNVFGTANGAVDFDPGEGVFELTGVDAFVLKLDSEGNFVWARQFGGASYEDVRDLAVDADGNAHVVGSFQGVADFDPGPELFELASRSANNTDTFILRLDSSGNLDWVRQIGGEYQDNGIALTLDNKGDVYTTGVFNDTVDFDPGPGVFERTSTGSADTFVLKLDSLGAFRWARQISGQDGIAVQGVAVDAGRNIYIAGSFYGAVDFGGGPGAVTLTSSGSRDIFASKLDSGGNFVWARQMGGTGYDGAASIAVDAEGNSYTTGSFAGVADFDPGEGILNLTSAGTFDVFISKLDSIGDAVWTGQIGGADHDEALDVVLGSNQNIYLTGFFQRTVDFDPGTGVSERTALGTFDAFVARYEDATPPPACTLVCQAAVPNAAVAGSPILFRGSATPQFCGDSPTFSWTFGDGKGSSAMQMAAYAYESAGNFNWELHVAADDRTCTKSGQIAVNPPAAESARMLVPPAGSTLDGSSQQFEWSTGVGVAEYRLRIGSSLGADDIYLDLLGTQTSVVVTGLPVDGRLLYVSIESRIGDEWILRNVQYVSANEVVGPVIAEDGIVSANLIPKVTKISPGSIFSIFGENFTTETILHPNLDEDGRLARNLGGVCIEMNGERLPIFAVTPGQINAQASAAQPLGPADFVVIANCDSADALIGQRGSAISPGIRDLASPAANALVEAATPTFFLFPPLTSDGLIAARFNADAVAVAPDGMFHDEYGPSRPAVPGDIVVLYGTGWGETTARLDAGQLATEAAELLEDANPTISVGGVLLAPEDILYLGVTPGAAGLYQAAIRIPVNAQAGNNQVILTVYGKSTPVGPVVPVATP